MKNFSYKWLLFGLLLSFPFSGRNMNAQEVQEFATINDVLNFAKTKNHQFQNEKWQIDLAELTEKTAKINAFNPKIPTSAQVVDNINQQVSFLPGQVFGQPAGTFKELTIGQQYVSTFSVQPQFDIINLANIAQIKSAKTNRNLVENQSKINEQNLYERINPVYFNILSFNEQIKIIQENIKVSSEILRITQNKFNEGIARKQELNEAKVNLINLQDKLEQMEINRKLQYETLNLLLENEGNANLSENLWDYQNSPEILKAGNNLLIENARLQSELAQQEYQSLKYQNYPVLSFISSFNWQNQSNDEPFAKNSNWIDFSFLGLKLSYDLPTTLTKYSNITSKKIQLEITKNNEQAAKKENESRNRQMLLEYEKAVAQKENLIKIYDLKKDTYEKNFNQFKENILPLDKLLISQNEMLVSQLNIVLALANIGYTKTKIEINNQF